MKYLPVYMAALEEMPKILKLKTIKSFKTGGREWRHNLTVDNQFYHILVEETDSGNLQMILTIYLVATQSGITGTIIFSGIFDRS